MPAVTPRPPQTDALSTPAPNAGASAPRSWYQALAVYGEAATWRMLSLGFSSGLPLVLVLGSLSFWLREAGIDRSTIGYLSWVGLLYALKWTWSPLLDRLPIPWLTARLGRRRSWLLVSQALVMLGLVGMASQDPQLALEPLVACTLLVAWGSATQDIALDAFRIESADTQRQAALAAAYQSGYRLAMIWAGAGVLWIAARAQAPQTIGYQQEAWQLAYLVMAASMLPGVLTVVLSQEPAHIRLAPTKNVADWLRAALLDPFSEFVVRHGWRAALILLLIALYRISDVVLGIMAQPFYVDMGYSKDEVAAVTKVFGLIMTLLGALVGGVLSMRLGLMRVLGFGALLSAASNLLFSWLSTRGHDLTALIWVISVDNLAGGMASAAFIAYMSSLTHVHYSATQYALFSSLVVLAPKVLAGFSGRFVDAFGYTTFFNTTALMGVPVLLLVWLVARPPSPRATP